MSNLRVNQVVNLTDNGPVEFAKGITIPGGIDLVSNINVTGIATAAAFYGDGSGIRNFIPNEVETSKVIALSIIT